MTGPPLYLDDTCTSGCGNDTDDLSQRKRRCKAIYTSDDEAGRIMGWLENMMASYIYVVTWSVKRYGEINDPY